MWIHPTTNTIFTLHSEIRTFFSNVSFPELIDESMLQELGIYPVMQAPIPMHDPIAQIARELPPVLTNKGHYEQVWEVIDLEPEQIVINEAKKAEQDNKTIVDKVESLWAAANAYTTGFISGVAIGILTIGVLQGKPKSLAVSAWSKVIWDEYYIRKAGITVDSNLNLDFSSFGPIPYTIPELSEETMS